ncbi:biotin-dependent carboxyltransferase family protein [Hyphomonas sp.]|jgi:biotin-dependent carboxylase-like uncharacterized protein|uniref:5-oxoprolinase subunit C family protein n=1 Tax=Hyphomonas sp. TaxID=87 RepID=UPI0025C4B7EC|nr:biotin-dependent carboxyltransferase family protein [Hyphomonas sp.]
MSLRVIDPGIQCTVQAAPRLGYRHAGVPYGGAADPLSMALANRLCGNPADAPCLEIAYGPASFAFDSPVQVALTGAPASVRVMGATKDMHALLEIGAGDVLEIGAASTGSRIYLAVAGEIAAESFLGSQSTYVPARFGGHQGRALAKGDELAITSVRRVPFTATPAELSLPLSHSFALRVVPGPDFPEGAFDVNSSVYHVSRRLSRMGAEIEGPFPPRAGAGLKPSAAVFPGALQVTPQGRGYLLLPDGQTTGGYPHLLQVIRADRHLLGQLRPGDSLRFLLRSQAEAEAALRAKQALIAAWVTDFRL